MSWANELRPSRFEDVVGQAETVKQLSGYILRGPAARKVFIKGPRGLGKTTLVPIYAQALNCKAVSPYGSPCGQCENCQRMSEYFFKYNVPRHPRKEEVQDWLDGVQQRTIRGLTKTIFFDEAQAFKAGAMEVLLDPLENLAPDTSICVATSEPWRLTHAFRSRFQADLSVAPLSLADSLKLLEQVARRKGLRYEREALVLIAKLKRGFAREMVHALEQVFLYEHEIRLSSVEAVMDLQQGQDLTAYLMAVVEGDCDRSAAARRAWRSSAAEQIILIRAFLTALFYQDVSGQNVQVSAVADSLSKGRVALLSALQRHCGVSDRHALRPFARAMMEFWFSATTDDDEGALVMQIACFEEFVRGLASATPNRQLQISEFVDGSRPRTRVSISSPANSSPYIQFEDVRDIVNRASFFVQHYGMTFNALLYLLPPADSRTERDAFERLAECVRVLEAAFPPESNAAFIAVREGDEGQTVMRVAGYFPHCDCVADLTAILKLGSGCAIVAEAEFAPRHGRRRLQSHWQFVKELCAGYADVKQLGDEFVLEKLKFARQLCRIPQPVADARPIFSGRLHAEEINRACENGMEFLSPFDAEAWEAVGGAWQLDEYEDRRDELKARKLVVSDLTATHRHDPNELEEALGKLIACWKELSAYDRQRRWTKGRWW
jgi:hypothetical protein